MKRIKSCLAALLLTTALPAAACGTPLAGPGPMQLAFLFETWDEGYAPLPHMLIAVTGTGLRKDGSLGLWYNQAADGGIGAWVPYPMKVAEYTPFTHSQTVSPGEAAIMSFTGVFLGKIGQYVTCSVFVNGEVQTAETQEARIEQYISGESTPTSMLGGSAVVTCSYTLAAPLSN